MRTTCSSSHLLMGGVCLCACWDTPLSVGLETPLRCRPEDPPRCGPGDPRPDPSTSPPWVWAWRPCQARPLNFPLGVGLKTPQARPLNFPPGCGPGDLQGMLGNHPPGDLQTCLDTTCNACWETTSPLWTE